MAAENVDHETPEDHVEILLFNPEILDEHRVILCDMRGETADLVLQMMVPFLLQIERNAIDEAKDKIGKLIDRMKLKTGFQEFIRPFNAFVLALAGIQPDLFSRIVGRQPESHESAFCLKSYLNPNRACIIEKGHSTDSPLDERIDLEKEHVQLTIIQSKPVAQEEDQPKYGPPRVQGEKSIPAIQILQNPNDIDEPKRVLLHGRGGIGKSTTGQWLSRQWALGNWGQQFTMIFFLSMSQLVIPDSSVDVVELLALHSLYSIADLHLVKLVKICLQNFAVKVLVIIDGIDVIAGFSQRLQNCTRISNITQKAHPTELCLNMLQGNLIPGCTIISTSRQFNALNELQFDRKLEVLGLSEQGIEQFVAYRHKDSRKQIISVLQEEPLLMSICQVTFYCSLISSLLSSGVAFDAADLQTYTRLISFITIQYVSRKRMEWPFVIEARAYFPKLARLAYNGIFKKPINDELPRLHFNEYDIAEVGLSPKKLQLVQNAGLLQMEKQTVSLRQTAKAQFIHQSIQEMLGAAYLLADPASSDDQLRKLLVKGHFSMALLHVFGLQYDNKSPWVRDIMFSVSGNMEIRTDITIAALLKNLFNCQEEKVNFRESLRLCQLVNEGQMEEEAAKVAEMIAPDGNIYISNTYMTVIDLIAIRFVCNVLNGLNQLVITSSYFTDTLISFLASSILADHADTVELLSLEANHCNNQGAEAIAKWLSHNICLQTLNLSENSIGETGAVRLAEALQQSPTLQHLYLRGNDIGEDGAKALANVLESNTTLTTLDVGWNKIGSRGCIALATGLQKNRSLLVLHVNGNRIGNEGFQAISETLCANTTLRDLDVSLTDIGTRGAETLARALLKNQTLQGLHLSHNNIGSAGARALSDVLRVNHSLHSLDVSWNNIGPEGGVAIAEALYHNDSLLALLLNWNIVGERGAEALAEMLLHNSHLKVIHIKANNVGPSGANLLRSAGVRLGIAITWW